MNWEAFIAGLALLVSVGTAIFSYTSQRRGQNRQLLFEVGMRKLQSLETTKKDVAAVSLRIRQVNQAGLAAIESDKRKLVVKNVDTMVDLCLEMIELYRLTKHNLYPADVQDIDSQITTMNELVEIMKDGNHDPFDEFLALLGTIATSVEKTIDRTINELQEELSSPETK